MVHRLRVQARTVEENLDALGVVRARVGDLKPEGAILSTGAESAMAERNILDARTGKLEAAAATCNGELGVLMLAVRLLKTRVVVGADKLNTADT